MGLIATSASICSLISCLSGCVACIAFIVFLISNGFHKSAVTSLIICFICCCSEFTSSLTAGTAEAVGI